jgi:tetratricopeptide (TPR) repeat protein
VDEQNLAQMERLKQDFVQLQHRAPQLKQSLIVRDESLRPFSKLVQTEDTLQPHQLLKTKKQEKQFDSIREKGLWPDKDDLISLRTQEQTDKAVEKKQGSRELDVYEQMKQEIESVRKTLESINLGGVFEPDEEDVEDKEESEEEKTSSEKTRRQRKTLSREEEIDTWEAELEKQITSITPREELTGLALSVRAKSIMGEHKTFASYSEDNFNQHMRAAEQYLKEGKYYRAADTYTLASMYKRNDPLAYAGKSHALFAAGGYMSSALFLSRTLEIFPEYARFKVDLVGMVGDRDKVESRIADIKLWIEKSDSAELQFLLGYVYYQIGRAGEAKKAINAAYKKLPDRPAVIALKKAIDSAVGENQTPK